MIRSLTAIAALSLALAPSLSFAQGAPPPTSKFNPDEMICHKMAITGSRLGARKICQTRAQWEARSRSDRRQFDESMQRSFSANCTVAMGAGCGG